MRTGHRASVPRANSEVFSAMGGEGFWWYVTLEGQEDRGRSVRPISQEHWFGNKGLPGRMAVRLLPRVPGTSVLDREGQDVISPWPGVKIVDMGRIGTTVAHGLEEAFPLRWAGLSS